MKKIDEIFKKYEENKNNIMIPLSVMKENLREYENSIVLYGAGSAGIAFLHYLLDVNIYPVYFSDGDSEKWGKRIENLEVISPKDIVRKVGNNALVIVTINTDGKNYCKDFKKELLEGGHQGVHKKLRECGCNNVIDYTYFRRCYELFRGERYNLPACSDVNLILENKEKIKTVYEILSDDASKDTFLKILEFRLISDHVDIPTFPEYGMYFEYDLFEKKQDEVFVDCGACGGSSLKEFLHFNSGEFSEYYGIEPDLANYQKLIDYIKSIDVYKNQLYTFPVAAYSHDKGTPFYILNGPGTFQAESGVQIVPTKTIDHILDGKKATYIKMNIEGSEVDALIGAEKTIKTYFPRLAIMGYHKTNHFWEVPLLIKSYNSKYRLSLRSYMKNVAFAYYAY